MNENCKNQKVTSGFVSVIGRTNAGKSTLLNNIIQSPLALVSKKANATRKKMDFIVPFQNNEFDSQIIFLDTPGLHKSEKILNEYMLKETASAMRDSDLCVFISVASKNNKEIEHYKSFLETYKKKHIVILNKIDTLTHDELLANLAQYQEFESHYFSLIPIKANNLNVYDRNLILLEISKHLPHHPHFYDNDILSTILMREIYKEAIREVIFEFFSDEIPYESDVKILKVTEEPHLIRIKAQIIVEKDSQKAIIIGKQGKTIKALGTLARKKCEQFSESKIFLELHVKTLKGWSRDKTLLKKLGYDIDKE
ncbi:GTPase Era [Helicobacter didelphidarum]|uniref:GTPase Era n=1 Tax=Helicobacter didelphidarum TaxID=2040648 RepID=A0A3D8IM92_9HELI|nr:GTPase Era [Helicobacter didelphidarum]RDU66397.1 GTPase Era [Helicobacter didelphidarum]